MSYQTIFGAEYNPEITFPEGWQDFSYKHDACAKFLHVTDTGIYCLWVEHKDPAEREHPDNTRYILQYSEDDAEEIEYATELASTDDINEIQILVLFFTGG